MFAIGISIISSETERAKAEKAIIEGNNPRFNVHHN